MWNIVWKWNREPVPSSSWIEEFTHNHNFLRNYWSRDTGTQYILEWHSPVLSGSSILSRNLSPSSKALRLHLQVFVHRSRQFLVSTYVHLFTFAHCLLHERKGVCHVNYHYCRLSFDPSVASSIALHPASQHQNRVGPAEQVPTDLNWVENDDARASNIPSLRNIWTELCAT